MSAPAVVVDGVSKRFRLYKERNESLKAAFLRGGRAKYDEFWALRDVSLQIPEGATFGLMGVNGSGKSTLLKCVANILRPDAGTVRTAGKVAALLELGSGFHQELSGRENVYLNGSILGLSRRELDRKFDEIVEFAGVQRFIDQPVKNYSSGMYVRLGFSVAINVDPDVLLVDEVLAVGDQAFQEKCMAKFADFKRRGKTVVIVSHALGSLRSMCDEVAWLAAGELVETGRPERIIDRYIDEGHQAEQADDGSSHWGSGEVRITRVQVLDRAGAPATLLHTGDEATVRIEFDASQPVDAPVFGLSVFTREGTEVWSQHTRDAGLAVGQIAGAGHLDVQIPALPLLPGAFDVSASVADSSMTQMFDFHRHAAPFHVEAGPRRDSGGLVSFGAEWRLPVPAALPG